MKVYRAPRACSLAVHVALSEIDAIFDSTSLDLLRHTIAARHYLVGPHSIDDAYAFSIVYRTYLLALSLSLSLTRYSRLQTYLTRVSERPRVQGALRADGLVQ